MRKLRRAPLSLKRLMVGLLVLIVLLALIEVGLRLSKLITEDYYIWIPNSGWHFEPYPEAMPGVDEGGILSISAEGLRGDPYDPDPDTIHILTLGGSTTECLYLDQARTWPELMGDQLAEQSGRNVWVGNAARSAMRSPESVISARYLLPQLGDVDYVVAMLGANDMITFLRKGSGNLIDEDLSRGYILDARMHRTFNQWPNPLARNLQIVERIWQVDTQPAASPANSEPRVVGAEYIEWRARRQNADTYLDTLPNLDAALAVYRLHLESLIRLARDNGAEMVLITQPALYAENMTPEAEARLWLGDAETADGSSTYYTLAALIEAFAAYNQEMLSVCRNHNAICIDAASALNGNPAYFYDDVHLNYAGAEVFSALLSEQLALLVTEPR
jgi:lysophospholipase L1-like esterase